MGSLAVLDQPSLAALGAAIGVVVVGSVGGPVAITGAAVAGATVVVVAGSVGAGATTTGRSGSLVDGREPRARRAAGSSPYTLGSSSAADRSCSRVATESSRW